MYVRMYTCIYVYIHMYVQHLIRKHSFLRISSRWNPLPDGLVVVSLENCSLGWIFLEIVLILLILAMI